MLSSTFFSMNLALIVKLELMLLKKTNVKLITNIIMK